MAEFAYNNAKNTSIGHMPFKLNYSYHLYISYKKEVDLRSMLKLIDYKREIAHTIALVSCKLSHVQL